jgi:hypothetical protein
MCPVLYQEDILSIWTLLQIVFDLAVFANVAALWMRMRRPPQDDPRLSRGLQLLQTKITVLEDLSDRTDAQVKQLSALLDQKNRMLQNKILEAEQQVLKIDHSMNKSMEVAEIFQDKIPHQEILERQRTVEYVRAARMANSGLSVEQIAESVALPREQIELIAKFNRDQLMFDESALPEWATRTSDDGIQANGMNLTQTRGGAVSDFGMPSLDFVNNLEKPTPDFDQMARLESEFKAAVKTAKENEMNPPSTLLDNRVADTLRQGMSNGVQSFSQGVQSGMQTMQPAVMSMKATAQTLRDKLVSTAEDLLRTQSNNDRVEITSRPATSNNSAMTYSANATSNARPASHPAPTMLAESKHTHVVGGDAIGTRNSSPEIKRVIFPKIER